MFTYYLVKTRDELNRAVQLVTLMYKKSGYIPEGGQISNVSTHLFSPRALTFFVKNEDGALVGTISVIPDSEKGLPMQEIFSEELASLRQHGTISEVCQFAIDRNSLTARRDQSHREATDQVVSIALIKIALQCSMRAGFAYCCIAVNPKHESFYHWLGFERFGETKEYASVAGAPAVPMKLDLKQFAENHRIGKSENWMVAQIFAEPLEERVLTEARMKLAGSEDTQ